MDGEMLKEKIKMGLILRMKKEGDQTARVEVQQKFKAEKETEFEAARNEK